MITVAELANYLHGVMILDGGAEMPVVVRVGQDSTDCFEAAGADIRFDPDRLVITTKED